MSDKDLVSKVYKRNLKTHRKANHPIFFLKQANNFKQFTKEDIYGK